MSGALWVFFCLNGGEWGSVGIICGWVMVGGDFKAGWLLVGIFFGSVGMSGVSGVFFGSVGVSGGSVGIGLRFSKAPTNT